LKTGRRRGRHSPNPKSNNLKQILQKIIIWPDCADMSLLWNSI